jgi:alanyl-tRNA synthetase
LELGEQYQLVQPLQTMLAVKGEEALGRVAHMQERIKDLEREVARLKREAALREVDGLLGRAVDLNGARVVVARLDGFEGNELRAVAQTLRDRLGENGVAAVISECDGKVGIVVCVGKGAQTAFPAGTVVNKLAGPLGGKGGGKPDMAQAGAKDASRIDEVVSGAAALLA